MPDSYWLRLGRRSEGPFPIDEIRRRAVRGRITPAHSISRDGVTWVVARRCPEIYAEDGTPIQPGPGGARAAEPLEGNADAEWDAGALAQPTHVDVDAPVVAKVSSAVAAWPAYLACAVTLGVACGLPMSRDAEGALWWWHVVRLGDLGGAGLVTAAIAWALVSACALATALAIWIGAGPGRLLALTVSAVASMVLASMAWASGMAGGAWTLCACGLVPASAWTIVRSMERPAVPPRKAHGVAHPVGGGGAAMAALGAIAVISAVAAILVRDGASAMACTLLMFVGGAGAIAGVIRWRAAGPDEWTTMIPCGVIVMACGALVCDGLAAMAATPSPPSEGTRFAVLDAIRVTVVLLCQCTLAYLAHRDHDSVPYAARASAPNPGTLNT